MKREADFTKLTKGNLALAANFRCVRPGCGQLTHAFNPHTQKFQHVGSAAHDVGAGKDSPRADVGLSVAQRKAYDNGAWLCRHCAEVVDRFEDEFKTGTISGWQKQASDAILKGVVKPISGRLISLRESCIAAHKFLQLFKQVEVRGRPPHMQVSYKSYHAMGEIIGKCWERLGPISEYSTLFPHTVNIQESLVETIRIIRNRISISEGWHHDKFNECYATDFDYRTENLAALDVWDWWHDAMKSIQELNEFALTGKCKGSDMLSLW